MTRLALGLLLPALAIGCTANPRSAPSSPVAPSTLPRTSSSIRAIAIGDVVMGSVAGDLRAVYAITPASDGTLTVRVSFNSDAHLVLIVDDDVTYRGTEPDPSPVVARIAVAAGRQYELGVEESVAVWDYGDIPFVLTTALE